jgi:pilus assembly protein FimV
VKERIAETLTSILGLVILAPASVWALNIGDIEVHSALNQKFNAELSVHLEAGTDPQQLSVKIATPAQFQAAGYPWNKFLTHIQLKTLSKDAETVLVKLTSKKALTDSVLDILLEVNNAEDRQVKNFLVTLKSPAQQEVNSTTPIDASATATPSGKELALPLILDENGRLTISSDRYNLWKIAKQMASERGVSAERMLIGLYRANPDAFVNRDINLLKLGASLTIPDNLQLLAEKKIDSLPATANAASETSEPLPSTAVDLTRKTTENINTAPQQKSADTLQAGLPDPTNSLNNTKTEELQSRVDKLEQQLEVMQQLISVKDQQLSALQNLAKSAETSLNATKQDIDNLSSASTYLSFAGISLAVFSLLIWLWRYKKRLGLPETINLDQNTFADKRNSHSGGKIADRNKTDAFYNGGKDSESSFISELTPSDLAGFDAEHNEVDPLLEVDVYLAYGHYLQAEKIMRETMLLEIFYTADNRQAFLNYAQELANEGKQTDTQFWAKVAEMTQEIVAEPAASSIDQTANLSTVSHTKNYSADPFSFNFDHVDLKLVLEKASQAVQVKEDPVEDTTTLAENNSQLGLDINFLDEFETKIDLAKAYVEMGEINAAKIIANDILKKGNAKQQAIAKALFKEIE